jgi:hypothetical protein
MHRVRSSKLLVTVASVAVLTGVMTVAIAAGGSVAGAATPSTSVCTFNGHAENSILTLSPGGVIAIKCTGLPDKADLVLAIASPLAGFPNIPGTSEGDLGALKFVGASATGTLSTSYTLPTSFTATDPNAVCPVTQAQVNAGLIGCAVAVAQLSPQINYGDAIVQYTGQPEPQAPSLHLSPSATPAVPGTQVNVSGTNWWGDTFDNVPVPASGITIGGVQAGSSSASVAAATYPAVDGTLTAPALSGSFVVPCGVPSGTQTVDVTEPNGSGYPGAVTGTGTLAINSSGTAPAITSLSPTYGPPTGGNTVTIGGCNFAGTTAVDFGSTPATSFTVTNGDSISAVAPAGTGTVNIFIHATGGVSGSSSAASYTFESAGYTMAATDGGTFSFGASTNYGSLPGLGVVPAAPIDGIAELPNNKGYWLTGFDGGVYSFGSADFYGSLPSIGIKTTSTSPIVGITSTTDGLGYWLVSANGSVYAFGDAKFYGSLPGLHVTPSLPITGIVGTGSGYLLVGGDGGVYAFGNAKYHGSLPAVGDVPSSTVVGITTTSDAGGYWLVGADGSVYAFGDAPFHGSLPGLNVTPAKPIVSIVSSDTGGYALVGQDGGAFCFGDETFAGSLAGETLAGPVSAAAAG